MSVNSVYGPENQWFPDHVSTAPKSSSISRPVTELISLRHCGSPASSRIHRDRGKRLHILRQCSQAQTRNLKLELLLRIAIGISKAKRQPKVDPLICKQIYFAGGP